MHYQQKICCTVQREMPLPWLFSKQSVHAVPCVWFFWQWYSTCFAYTRLLTQLFVKIQGLSSDCSTGHLYHLANSWVFGKSWHFSRGLLLYLSSCWNSWISCVCVLDINCKINLPWILIASITCEQEQQQQLDTGHSRRGVGSSSGFQWPNLWRPHKASSFPLPICEWSFIFHADMSSSKDSILRKIRLMAQRATEAFNGSKHWKVIDWYE